MRRALVSTRSSISVSAAVCRCSTLSSAAETRAEDAVEAAAVAAAGDAASALAGNSRDSSRASRSGGAVKITVSLIGEGLIGRSSARVAAMRCVRADRAGGRRVAAERRGALLEHRLPLQQRVELLLELLLVEQLPAGDAVDLGAQFGDAVLVGELHLGLAADQPGQHVLVECEISAGGDRPDRHDHQRADHDPKRDRPRCAWIVVGTLVIMAIWSIATGTYFAFREDVLTRLIGRQAQMQFAYEDRIAELRAQVDRITSRQLLDQEQFEQKLKDLLQRQATLEQRTNALAGDVLTTGSIRPTQHIAPPAPPSDMQLKPSPINDTVIFTAPPDREARLESRELPASATRLASRGDGTGLNGILARVEGALDKVAHRQTAALTDIEEHVDTKSRRMQGVLADLGVSAGTAPAAAGVGGPFVPLKAPGTGASAFDRQLYRINIARAQIDHLITSSSPCRCASRLPAKSI